MRGQHFLQIGLRVEPIELGRLHQTKRLAPQNMLAPMLIRSASTVVLKR